MRDLEYNRDSEAILIQVNNRFPVKRQNIFANLTLQYCTGGKSK